MTDTDNKDPHITAEIVKLLRIKSDMINMGEKIAWGSETALMDEAADLIDQLSAELKQLRAEREGLLSQIEYYLGICNDTRDDTYLVDILTGFKSKLTDLAQRSVTTEESGILGQALIDSSEPVHEGKLGDTDSTQSGG